MLKLRSETLSVERAESEQFAECYLVKSGPQSSFVRVFYSEELMAMVTGCWLSGHLSDFDKFWVISDRSAFMASGYLSATDFLEFLAVVGPEEAAQPALSYLVWDEIVSSLLTVDSLFCAKHGDDAADGVRSRFRRFARGLLSASWSAIGGWNATESDSEDVVNLRSLMINALVRFEDEELVRDGAGLWTAILAQNGGAIPVNADGQIQGIDGNLLRSVMECVLSVDSGSGVFDVKCSVMI